MIETIYIEEKLKNHPKVIQITHRFPKAHLVYCERYQEIFNRKAQSFRLQKQNPALILAEKKQGHVLPVPENYGLFKPSNYYFSHILNCLYDCRYCFLQGMYRSAHYVLFVNFEDFQSALIEKMEQSPKGATFFSGYDGDSLALNFITNFIEDFVSFFKNYPKHELELRTKSNAIQPLLHLEPASNIILAYSLNPKWVVDRFEHKTARLNQRLKALKILQEKGWPIGLRFDPLIYHPNWQESYNAFFDEVFSTLNPHQIHSITLGTLRMPQGVAESMKKQYYDEPLFFSGLCQRKKQVTYLPEIEQSIYTFCKNKILDYAPENILFSCMEAV